MNNKMLLAALSQDLYRVAIGYHESSVKIAERFSQEVLKRRKEVDVKSVKPYIHTILMKLPEMLMQENKQQIAEDALVYSILFQNYALKN
jgi:hypothetical protein